MRVLIFALILTLSRLAFAEPVPENLEFSPFKLDEQNPHLIEKNSDIRMPTQEGLPDSKDLLLLSQLALEASDITHSMKKENAPYTTEEAAHYASNFTMYMFADSKSGLRGRVFVQKQNSEIYPGTDKLVIIAFGATDTEPFLSTSDFIADLSMGIYQARTNVFRHIIKFAITQAETPNTKVVFAGQSLGGMLSQLAGYVAQAELLRIHGADAPKINCLVWGVPGMMKTIGQYIRMYDHKENSGISKRKFSQAVIDYGTFVHFHFKIDLLPKIGKQIGKIYLLPAQFIVPGPGQHYQISIPVVRKYLEAHLGNAFQRAFHDPELFRHLTNGESEKTIDIPTPLTDFFRIITAPIHWLTPGTPKEMTSI